MKNDEHVALPGFKNQQERAVTESARCGDAADQVKISIIVKSGDADVKIAVERFELGVAEREAREARQEADLRHLVFRTVEQNERDHESDLALADPIKAYAVFLSEVVQ